MSGPMGMDLGRVFSAPDAWWNSWWTPLAVFSTASRWPSKWTAGNSEYSDPFTARFVVRITVRGGRIGWALFEFLFRARSAR